MLLVRRGNIAAIVLQRDTNSVLATEACSRWVWRKFSLEVWQIRGVAWEMMQTKTIPISWAPGLARELLFQF